MFELVELAVPEHLDLLVGEGPLYAVFIIAQILLLLFLHHVVLQSRIVPQRRLRVNEPCLRLPVVAEVGELEG